MNSKQLRQELPFPSPKVVPLLCFLVQIAMKTGSKKLYEDDHSDAQIFRSKEHAQDSCMLIQIVVMYKFSQGPLQRPPSLFALQLAYQLIISDCK